MGLFNNLEQRLDRIVNGSFSKAFKAAVQPVEIAAALHNELDTNISKRANKSVVPNVFIVELSTDDFLRLEKSFSGLSRELCTLIAQHCIEQRYSPIDAPSISFQMDQNLGIGDMRILSESRLLDNSQSIPKINSTPIEAGQPVTVMVPEISTVTISPRLVTKAGQEFRITQLETTIGRSPDANITLDDSGVSRIHCSILLGSSIAKIVDRGSTNGIIVDGARVNEMELQHGAIITLGTTTLTYLSE